MGLLICGLIASAYQVCAQIPTNGGFETGAYTPWAYTGHNQGASWINIYNDGGAEGAYYCRINDVGDGSLGYPVIFNNDIASVSVYLNGVGWTMPTYNSVQFYIYERTNPTHVLASGTTINRTSGLPSIWTKYTINTSGITGDAIVSLYTSNVDVKVDKLELTPDMDDDTVSFLGTATEYSTQKYAGTFNLSVWRQKGTANQTTVQYYTADGTGHAGVDYGQTSGTLTWGTGEIYKTITVPIYNADPTHDRTFYVNLSNVQQGVLVDPKSAHVTVAAAGEYAVQVVPDPVTIMNTVQATLTINDPTYNYDHIVWQLDGEIVGDYLLTGSSQWASWTGTAYTNCNNATVFQRSDQITSGGLHKYLVVVSKAGAQRGYAETFFNATSTGQGTTLYKIIARDTKDGSTLDQVNAWLSDTQDLATVDSWTDGQHVATLTMYHHYIGSVNCSGYENSSISIYADSLSPDLAGAATIYVNMYPTDQPADPTYAFVDFIVKDPSSAYVAGAVCTWTNASGSKSGATNSQGTCTAIMKRGETITWKAATSSLAAKTGSYTVPATGRGYIPITLNYIATPTATPTGTPGASGTPIVTWVYDPNDRDNSRQESQDLFMDSIFENLPLMGRLFVLVIIFSLLSLMVGSIAGMTYAMKGGGKGPKLGSLRRMFK